MAWDFGTGGCPNADYLDGGNPIGGRLIREHGPEGKPTRDDPARNLPQEHTLLRLLSG